MTRTDNTLRYQSANARSVFFVDPTNPRNSLRVGASAKTKRIGTESVQNVNADLTQLKRRLIKTCGTQAKCSGPEEINSIRIEFSHSIEQWDEVAADWNEFKANVDLAIAQGLLQSLKPALNAEFKLGNPVNEEPAE